MFLGICPLNLSYSIFLSTKIHSTFLFISVELRVMPPLSLLVLVI